MVIPNHPLVWFADESGPLTDLPALAFKHTFDDQSCNPTECPAARNLTCIEPCVSHQRRFIIGLPLFQKNAVEMSRQMMGQAKKYLGSSVMGYELGNEVCPKPPIPPEPLGCLSIK